MQISSESPAADKVYIFSILNCHEHIDFVPVLTDLIIDWIELSYVSNRKLKPMSELVT